MKKPGVQLTQEQEQCIKFFSTPEDTKRHLVIEAGAGAGKTQVLIQRVKWLLLDKTNKNRLEPQQLGIVTFSKNADIEIKERLEYLFAEHPQEKITLSQLHISTIDGLFAQMVEALYPLWWEKKQEENPENTRRMPTRIHLVDEEDLLQKHEEEIFATISQEKVTAEEFCTLLDFILSGALKKKTGFGFGTLNSIIETLTKDVFLCTDFSKLRITGKKVHPAALPLLKKIHQKAYELFTLRALTGEMTFADRNVFLFECFLKYKLAPPLAITELIVDEYQDTNELQHAILFSLVTENKARMVVVGDPKQSIYGFRNANVEVFNTLKTEDSWQQIHLRHNFRSQPALLEGMNELSQIAFQWQKKLPEAFLQSPFFLEAKKKHVAALPLLPGRAPEYSERPRIDIVAVSLNKKRISEDNPLYEKIQEVKFKDYQLWALLEFIQKFIAEKKQEEGFQWSNFAILCETRKQIEILALHLSQLGFPVAIEQQPEQEDTPLELDVALALAKMLQGQGSIFDLYVTLQSPLIALAHEKIEVLLFHIAQKAPIKNLQHVCPYTPLKNALPFEEPFLQAFLQCLVDHQELAKRNFAVAWQLLRWQITELHSAPQTKEMACAFAQRMDIFAAFLEEKADMPSFTLPEKNRSWKTSQATPAGEDALLLKTVHGAKGLEWPYVFFWPKQESRTQNTDFTVQTSSQGFLDITWLREDREKLSVIKSRDNTQFPEDDFTLTYKKNGDIKDIFWFSNLRRACEESFERQRVFYTSFTRAREHFVLLQPLLTYGKSGIRDDIEKDKDDVPHDSLAKEVSIRYLKNHFDLKNKKNPETKKEIIPEPWWQEDLKSEFLSLDNKVLFHEYGPRFVERYLEFSQKNQGNKKEKTTKAEVKSYFTQEFLGPEISPLLSWITTEHLTKDEEEKKFPQGEISFLQKIEQQREQRSKRTRGLVYHAKMEIASPPSSLQAALKAVSLVSFHEFELWFARNKAPGTFATKCARNIVDFISLVPLAQLPVELLKTYCAEHTIATQLEETLTKCPKDSLVIFVLDFKSGEEHEKYLLQIDNYLQLAQRLLNSLQRQESFPAPDEQNSHFVFIGALCFKNKIKTIKTL